MTVFARYATVLRGHGTAVPLVASIVGRLSLGMTSLALLLLVGLAGMAGYYAGLYRGYREGTSMQLRTFQDASNRAEAEAARTRAREGADVGLHE